MLHVKVKMSKVRLFIPVPYLILTLGISILSSKAVNHLINKWAKESTKEKEQAFSMPPLNKKELKSIVNELKRHRGLELVDVIAKDGTEVRIKL